MKWQQLRWEYNRWLLGWVQLWFNSHRIIGQSFYFNLDLTFIHLSFHCNLFIRRFMQIDFAVVVWILCCCWFFLQWQSDDVQLTRSILSLFYSFYLRLLLSFHRLPILSLSIHMHLQMTSTSFSSFFFIILNNLLCQS